ncbi:VOC family protein [Trichothermofontia sp.]
MIDIYRAFVTIATLELDALSHFYQDLLEQAPQRYLPQVYAEFQLPGLRLGLFQIRPSDRQEFVNPQQGTLSLTLEVADLETAIAQLTTLGYPPPGSIITSAYGYEIYAYDPMGNRLILYTPGENLTPPDSNRSLS